MQLLHEGMIKKITRQRITIFIIFISFFTVVFSFSAVASDEMQETPFTPYDVIDLVNKERTAHGLQRLTESAILDTVAQKKLQNMIQNDYFDHTAPDGTDPWEWFFRSGYDFSYAGENLATTFTTAKDQHDAWMASPKHRQNILDERFTNVGVAVGNRMIDGKKAIVTVQVFATPAKGMTISPNFTPQTFEVPDELFLAGTNSANTSLSDLEEKGQTLLKAGAIDVNGVSPSFLRRYPHVRSLAWIFIGVLVIVVIIIEYRLFARRTRR